jgi:hypothetical protein
MPERAGALNLTHWLDVCPVALDAETRASILAIVTAASSKAAPSLWAEEDRP